MEAVIFFLLRNGANRFSILQKAIPDIGKQMLVNQLREPKYDGMITLNIFHEIPLRVENGTTEPGKSHSPIIDAMSEWEMARMGEVSCNQ